MSKFVLILVSAVVSVAVATVVLNEDEPEIDWMKYANEGANKVATSNMQPIDWNKYGSGGFVNVLDNDHVNEESNKFDVKTDEQPNGENLNVIVHNLANEGNTGFLPKPDEQPTDSNKYGNGGNLNNVENNHANEWNVNVNGDEHAHEKINYTDCEATDEYKGSEGMTEWCRANCLHNPPFCPSTHCRCW